jgi:fibronectin-binding autotransporter adhesin
MTAGSIEGAGTYRLGSKALTVGLNKLSTEVAGTITDGGLGNGTGGALIKVGTGTLTLTGTNTYSGATTISAGTFQAGSTTAFSANSAFTVNSVLDLNGFSNNVGSLAGSGTVTNNGGTSATLTAGGDNTTTIFGGLRQDGNASLGLTKVGTGTLTLTGLNNYSGGTSLNGGIVAVNSDSNLGAGPLSFDSGTLEVLVVGGGIISNKPITLNSGGGTFSADTGTTSILNGRISGPGSLTMTGGGTVTLTGANTYSGGTNINGETVQDKLVGIVAVSSDSNLGTGPLGFDGGTLEVLATGGGIRSNKAITLSPLGGTIQVDAGTISTLSGAISGSGSQNSSSGTLRMSGLGTLILSGVNTYGGVTVVRGGTLKAGSSTAFSPNAGMTVFSVLDLNGSTTRLPSWPETGS